MAKLKSVVPAAPRQVSGVYSLTLFNEELGLIEGIARALMKQGVPVTHDSGLPNKLMIIKESVRQAAEKLGRETGDKALVQLADQLKTSFQTPKFRGRPTVYAVAHGKSARASASRKGR